MVIPETLRMHKIRYLCLKYYPWVDTSAGVLLVPKDIPPPNCHASALTWLITYICLTFTIPKQCNLLKLVNISQA